jgi:hypothetical protein
MISCLKFNSMRAYLVYFLLFLMLFAPFQYKTMKIILLFNIIFATIIFIIIKSRVYIDGRVLLWFLALIVNGLFFILWGIINGEPYSTKVLPVYVIWPIIYAFIIISVTNLSTISGIFRLFTFTTISISLYSLLYIFSNVGLLPNFTFLPLLDETGFSVFNMTYSTPSITSLFYLIPFSFSSLLLWDNKDNMPIKFSWLCLSIILSLSTMVFTGRRVFWIIFLLTPFFTFIFLYSLTKKYRGARHKIFFRNGKRMLAIFLGILCITAIIYGNDVIDFLLSPANSSTFLDAVTFKDEGTKVREEQLESLTSGWLNAPLLGAGHGASATQFGSLRSEDTPWAYELSYFALLFQTGLIGVSIYFLLILLLYYYSLKIIRENMNMCLYIIPSFVGMTCFLIANATNPYVQAYDHMWTIFFPVMIINVYFICNRRGYL